MQTTLTTVRRMHYAPTYQVHITVRVTLALKVIQ